MVSAELTGGLTVAIPFDGLDADQRDEVLTAMQNGLGNIRREYRAAADALTDDERTARMARATQGRLGMMQKLDQLGLIGWYQEQS